MAGNNTLYLVALALGPVQEFIAAARRTRDLWFGSFLLSEISKASARYLHERCGDDPHAGLIFPATENPDEDLAPCETNLNKDGTPPFNVPNKIMAVIGTDDPERILDSAKEAARRRWKELAEDVFDPNKRPRLRRDQIDYEIWNTQLDEILELFAAWVVYNPKEDRYTDRRRRLERLLAARKNTRDFTCTKVNGDRIPKSSLDGLRESVTSGDTLNGQEKLHLGLSIGEQLDCPGLVKRLGGEPEQFTPLSRIALDPWLRSLKQNSVRLPAEVIRILGEIKASGLGLISKVRHQEESGFEYDGQLLYQSRIDAELTQIRKLPAQDRNGVPELLQQLKTITSAFSRKHGEPSPYVAILAADGDRMGELIDAAESVQQHREISTTLSGFTKSVTKIIGDSHGQLIYAGGDDVLAIVPLDEMLDCAGKLADVFRGCWQKLREGNSCFRNHGPTLSVGIGISHMLTPMGRQLELAREAERYAKNNHDDDKAKRKNGLSIIYQPRSGDRIEFREQWDIKPDGASEILNEWKQLHQSRELPYRAAFQLRELGRVLGGWKDPDPGITREEIRRVMDRKRIKKDQKVAASVIDAICERGCRVGMEALANELILTQKLTRHTTFNKDGKERINA